LRSVFAGPESDADLWRSLERHGDPAVARFRALATRHIEFYGERVLQELKLETPTLEDDPSALVGMIRTHLRSPSPQPALGDGERKTRARAEAGIAARLRGHPMRRRLFRFVLSQTRRTIKNRETLRLARSRAIGIFKRIYGQIGRRLADRNLIGEARDIF